MFTKNSVSQSMIDAVQSVLAEDKKLLLEPEKKKEEPPFFGPYKKPATKPGHGDASRVKHLAKMAIPKGEVKEELKGNQGVLDKNHNGKLDKKDFELLRMKKEEVKDEYARKVDAYLKKKHAPAQPKPEEDVKESATLAAAVIGSAALMRASQKYKDWKAKNASKSMKKEEVELDEATMTHITLGKKVKNSDGGHNQDVHYKGKKIGSIESYKHRTGLRYGSEHDATGDMEAGSRSPEEAIDFVRTSHADHLKSMKEDYELDEANTESKKEFLARQARLAAASAETAKDPERLKRMMKIPGYADAMGLAKKTTTKEEVEELDELSKSTLGSYAKKASRDAVITRKIGADFENRADRARSPGMKAGSQAMSQKYKEKSWKRRDGVDKAVDRLTKEEVELDEAINDNMHPAGVALLKHIKPEHHNLYKPHLTTDVFNGSFRDRHDVLTAAKQAGHLNEDIGAMQSVVGENKGKKPIRVDTLKGPTISNDPEVRIANAHFSGKAATLKAEGKGTDTAVPFVTDSVTHREINKAVKPTFKKIKEMLGKTGTSEEKNEK
jgi:hypothetical protein